MTVTTTNVDVDYVADGVTTDFPTTFEFLNASDVKVAVDGVLVVSGFSVTGAGTEGGGTIIFDMAPVSGLDVHLERLMPVVQEIDPINNSTIFGNVLARGLDTTTMIVQQLQKQIEQGIELAGPAAETAVAAAAAALEAAAVAVAATASKRDKVDPKTPVAVSYAALKAVSNPVQDYAVYLGDGGRSGQFVLRYGDYTARLASDPLGFVYAKHDSIAANTACWVRDRQDMRLNICWGGAVGDGVKVGSDWVGTDNTAIIAAALNLLKVENFGELYFPPSAGDYLTGAQKYSALRPICISGVGGNQGTYIGGGKNTSNIRYVPALTAGRSQAAPGDFFVIESSSATAEEALTGFIMRDIGLYTEDQAKASGGRGLVCRGVYGANEVRNVTISGFANSHKTDDNPTNLASGSTRNGKFTYIGLRCVRAAYRRVDIGAMASAQFLGCPFLEESLANYDCDLRFGDGTRGGRSDDLQFFGCQFIGSGFANAWEYPDYNVVIDGAQPVVNAFYGCAFEQSRLAGVKITVSTPDVSYTNLTLVNPWFNGHQGYHVDSLGARTVIINTGGGPGAAYPVLNPGDPPAPPTAAASKVLYRFRGANGGTTTPRIGGGMIGGNVSFYGPGAVSVDNASGVVISDLAGADYSGHGYPVVVFGPYADQCSAFGTSPSMDTAPDTGGVVNSGTNNSFSVVCGAEAGAAYGGGPNMGNGKWVGFTPTVTANGGTIGANSGTMSYVRRGNTLEGTIDWSFVAGGTGFITFTMPVAAAGVGASPPGGIQGAGFGSDVTGTKGGIKATINPGTSNLVVTTGIDNSYPVSAGGSRLALNFFYRVA